MDRLPRHFRRSPSEWNDIGNFINTRARNNSRGHFKSFQNYLKLIANASDATEDQKAAAVDLMETITLPEFQVQLRLAEQRAKASADDHSKTIVRENSFTCARTLIIHAESEIVKSITGQPSNRQVGGQSSQTSNQQPQASTEQGKQHRKRSRSDELEISSFFSEPWGSLIKILHDRLRCGVSNTSIPPGVDLSVPSKALYTFIRAHLQDDKDLTEHEQDLLVALSGVINLRVPNAREIYGVRLINNIEALAPAAQPDTSISPTLKSLKDILDKNGLRYLRDEISLLDTERILKVRRGEHVEPSLKVVLDVVRFLS
ncbi:hypothetical protein B0O80DRAFT_305969 [Mortierella sp. GBAus27b]|nr:hypothetical protein B0O80DRAFT_305969 [Mortierella sp. GBAus27b]